MTEWIVSSVVLIVVVALVRQLLKGKISLRLQYALWALVLIRLLVPISFGETKFSVLNAVPDQPVAVQPVEPEDPLMEKPVQTPVGGGTEASTPAVIPTPGVSDPVIPIGPALEPDPVVSVDPGAAVNPVVRPEPPAAEVPEKPAISVELVLTTVWVVGIVGVGLWFLFTNFRFWLRLRRSRRVLELDYPVKVYISGAAETPCLFGLIRPAVYLTPEVAEVEVALRHVLAHELTHYHHWDHIWSVLRCICLAVHWYNPLVWLAASLSRRDAELACDESTIRRIGEEERTAYGRTLIGLTCVHRSNLLHTATTMTGSKKSIKERIVLIAKKPKMAIYTLIAVILIAAIAVGCTFTGAKEKKHPFTERISTVTESMIGGAYIGSDYRVPSTDYEELLSILQSITEAQCIPVTELDFGSNITYRLQISTGLDEEWQFYYLQEEENTVGVIFLDEEGREEAYFDGEMMIYPTFPDLDGCWLKIKSPELCQYIMGSIEDFRSGTVADADVPQAVVEKAEELLLRYLNERIAEYADSGESWEFTSAMTGLGRLEIDADRAGAAVKMYQMEYSITGKHETEKLTETKGFGGTSYLIFLDSDIHGEPVFVNAIEMIECANLYGTREMLIEYGDMHTAAAMELYHEWLEEQDSTADPNAERLAYFQDLLTWDGGTTHFNGAMTCAFDSPENINLEYVFYTGFPGGEGWSNFTEEEKAYLIAEGMRREIEIQKRPSWQLEQALQAYFGVSLSQLQIPDSWVYYEATDSYYSGHSDTHVMERFTVTKVEQGEDGLVYVYYTTEYPIFRQDGTTLDGWEHNMLLTLRSIASHWGSLNDSGYMVLANQTVNVGQPVTQPDIQQIVNGILVGELSYDDSWQSMGNYTLTAIGADDRIDTYACVPRTFYALEHTPGYKLMSEYKWTQVDRFQWTGMAGNKYSLQFANDNYSFTVYCNENKLEIQAYGKVFYFVGTPNTSFKYRDYSDLFLDFLSYAESARHAYELNACWVDGSETDYDVIARKLAEQYAQTILNRPDWCQQQAQDARVNAVEVFDAYYGADNPNFCFNKMLYIKVSDEQRNDWEVGAGLYGPLTDGMYSGYFEHSLEVNVVKCEDGNWRMVSMGTGGAEVYLPVALDNATTKQLMELYFLTEGQTHDWWIRDRLLRKPLEEMKQELNMLGLGYRLQLSKALLEYTVEQPHLAAWTADDFNAHSDLHVATNGEGLTFRAEGVTDAAEEFTRVYGEALMACYDFILDYECSSLLLFEASKNGDAVIGRFTFDVQPEEGSDQRFASAVFEERQDGRMRSDAHFLLEKVGEDLWRCTVYDSDSQLFLKDYGYEDGLIGGILHSSDVFSCTGTDPVKAAEELMIAYLDAMKEPADLRSFTITKYRNLAVSVTPTFEVTGFELDEYRLTEEEIGENTWIVEISEIEYQWDGLLHDPPGGPRTGVPDDSWETVVHQGSGGIGFLLTQNGNEFTLQSRWEIRY